MLDLLRILGEPEKNGGGLLVTYDDVEREDPFYLGHMYTLLHTYDKYIPSRMNPCSKVFFLTPNSFV